MIATDPLSLVFIFCFLLGFGFFLIASLMGGHGHGHAGHGHIHMAGAHHAPAHVRGHVSSHAPGTQTGTGGQHGAQHGPQQAHSSLFGYLNPTTIALFLLGFGLFGYLFHNLTPLALSLSLLLAVVAGFVLTALLLLLLNRLFANSEGSTEQDVVDRTGMLGRVSITIPEKGLGEILYTSPGGMRKSIAARGLNNQRLERDLEVVVVNYQHGVAEVDTWEHFMQQDTSASYPASADELAQLRALLNDDDSASTEMVMQQEQQKESS